MMNARERLAEWMDEADGWKSVPSGALYDFVCEAVGASGWVFANPRTSELVMCDSSDIVLWRMVDKHEVYAERERCAKIADKYSVYEESNYAEEIAEEIRCTYVNKGRSSNADDKGSGG